MTKREYAEQVAKIVGGKVIEVEKPNMITLTGIQFGQDDTVKPCYYIDDYYDDDMDVNDAAESIKQQDANQFGNIAKIKDTVSAIHDFDAIKNLLRVRLYNNHSQFEISRNAAEYGFSDMIMVPYIELNECMAAKVNVAMIKAWGVDEDEVFGYAINNTMDDVVIKSMQEMLAEFMPAEMIPQDDHKMYVVSNEHKAYGASAILFAKDRLQEIFPDGYIVIPSSIHEVIVLSKENVDMSVVCELIGEVNETKIKAQERLSDHAYEF